MKFITTVKKVEEKSRTVRGWMAGDKAMTETEKLGWFILLDGSWEYLHIGKDRPDFSPGDLVSVSIEKIGSRI